MLLARFSHARLIGYLPPMGLEPEPHNLPSCIAIAFFGSVSTVCSLISFIVVRPLHLIICVTPHILLIQRSYPCCTFISQPLRNQVHFPAWPTVA
jgi:hypothetical protein